MAILRLTYDPDIRKHPVKLPLSKSIALRVMILDAVCRSLGCRQAKVEALPDCDDTKGLADALRHYENPAAIHRVIHIGEGGAPFRFFTALAAQTPGTDITLTGGKSLRGRPASTLLEILREDGADIKCLHREGYPPIRIKGAAPTAGELGIEAGVSSQFISAMMLTAPLRHDGLRINVTGERAVSMPYLRMTASIMRRFGIEATVDGRRAVVAPGRPEAPASISIEPDWSAASYFYELALLLPGVKICISRLIPPGESIQGDAKCAAIFREAGVETIWGPDGTACLIGDPERAGEDILTLDLSDTPDLAPAIAVGFCLAGIRYRLTGTRNLRHKESDRTASLSEGLARLGYVIRIGEDTLSWLGDRCEPDAQPVIKTYSDHRIAMAFAVAAVTYPAIGIEDPGVASKSFPCFWEEMERVGIIGKREDYR